MQYEPRIRALQAVLRSEGPSTLLITDPSNVRYMTGLDASDAMLLVGTRAAILFVDGRYGEAAGSTKVRGLTVKDRSSFAASMKRIPRCGFEGEHVTVSRLLRWKSLCKSTKFIQAFPFIEGLRRKKDSSEIRRMKRALAITDAVLALLPHALRPGMTEVELARLIEAQCFAKGADGLSFPTIVAFGSSTSRPHHVPGKKRLRKRDIVQIDMGARYDGYCSDRSEVFFVGTPTARQREVYDAVSEAKRAAEKATCAGARCADIDAIARSVLRKHALEHYFVHALGHGVGLDIHEGVSLSRRSGETLLEHEVVTVEPGVYIPGRFGIRLESMLFVR